MPSKRRKTLWHAGKAILIAFASIFLASGVLLLSDYLNYSPFQKFENIIYDAAFALRPSNPTFYSPLSYEDVVIVDIDNASIDELGRIQQWPRLFDAQVINNLAAGQPYSIGIDMLYTENDSFLAVYKDLLKRRGVGNPDDIMASLSTDKDLASAIKSAGLVYLSLFDDYTRDPLHADGNIPDLRYLYFPPGNTFDSVTHLVPPIPIFNTSANATGGITMTSELDGVLRQYTLLQQLRGVKNGQELIIPNFPFYMLVDALGIPQDSVHLEKGKLVLDQDHVIPINERGKFRLNWPGIKEQIRYVSYYKVLQGIVPSEFFANKFVFIGTSASGLFDLKAAPHRSGKIPGVETHAIALLNMANNGYITEFGFFDPWMLLIIIVFTVLISYFFIIAKPIVGLSSMLVIIIALIAIAVGIFFYRYHTMIPLVAIIFVSIITNILATTYNYFTEEKEKIQLKNAFSRYVSPTVVNKIIDDPKSLNLGGTKKVLSVLFSDIRGFTSYSEKMDPQNLVSILNSYLSAMSEPILAHEGTIDKFIGDAIFAIFGAPLEYIDHADEACEVAIEMINKLEEVNRELISKNFPPLKIGIGLNTGEMTVGNIGSSKRFDYTAIGDAVNLGSRVEGLTKHFKVDILVSHFTYDTCKKENFLFRALPKIVVLGKDFPVGIYQLINFAKERKKYEPWITYWENGHQAYLNQDFVPALEWFTKCDQLQPMDYSTNIYLGWCQQCIEDQSAFTNVLTMEYK